MLSSILEINTTNIFSKEKIQILLSQRTNTFRPSPLSLFMVNNMIIMRNARVLDIGTGSGIFAIAAKKLGANKIVAVDINETIFETLKENIKLNNIANGVIYPYKLDFLDNDNKAQLLDICKKYKINTILSNPPQLPISIENIDDPAYISYAGGKDGYEFTHEIIKFAYNYHKETKQKTMVELVISSVANVHKIFYLIDKYSFKILCINVTKAKFRRPYYEYLNYISKDRYICSAEGDCYEIIYFIAILSK